MVTELEVMVSIVSPSGGLGTTDIIYTMGINAHIKHRYTHTYIHIHT